MQEIFKAKETLQRSFLVKVICFDLLKEYLAKNRLNKSLESVIREILVQTTNHFDELKKRFQIVAKEKS